MLEEKPLGLSTSGMTGSGHPGGGWTVGTSGFPGLHADYGWVMTTAGHLAKANRKVEDVDCNLLGMTRVMIDAGLGEDAGFYERAEGVTFQNIINTWCHAEDKQLTLTIADWADEVLFLGDLVFIASGIRDLYVGTVLEDYGTYFRFAGYVGGEGDSGSPVFLRSEEGDSWGDKAYLLGVLTHGDTVVIDSTEYFVGWATKVSQIQSLSDVSSPVSGVKGLVGGHCPPVGAIPLHGAKVEVHETGQHAFTDYYGRYEIVLPQRSYTLTASYLTFYDQTYYNVQVVEGQFTQLNFVLEPMYPGFPIPLDDPYGPGKVIAAKGYDDAL